MRVAEEHRHDLMASGGKRPTDGPSSLSPLSFLHVVRARLGQLARWPMPPALTPGPPQRPPGLGLSGRQVGEVVAPGPKERSNRGP